MQREQHRGADGRVAGERQFACGREDAQPRAVAGILRRQHEHRLGMIELARDRLHCGGVEPCGIEHDGERIAGKAPIGKHVERRETPSTSDQASRWPHRSAAGPIAYEYSIRPPDRVNIKSVTAPAPTDSPTDPTTAPHDIFGHPRGLAVLFASETWERFSYFGNAALVVLYMVKYLFDPGPDRNGDRHRHRQDGAGIPVRQARSATVRLTAFRLLHRPCLLHPDRRRPPRRPRARPTSHRDHRWRADGLAIS